MRVSQPALLLGPLFFCGGLALLAACAEGAKAEDTLPTSDIDGGKPEEEGGKVKLPDNPDPDPDPDPNNPDGGGKKDGGSSGTTACASALSAATYSFDADAQNWTHKISDGAESSSAPNWPFDPWGHGTATNNLLCPATKCFASELAQNYAQCGRGELTSPKIDLSACAGQSIKLTFKHAFKFWTGVYNGTTYFDGGIVEISGNDGQSWSTPTGSYPGTIKINPSRAGGYNCVLPNDFHVNNKSGFVGDQAVATTVELSVPANLLTSSVRVRFSQGSGVAFASANPNDRSGTAAGWRIDDVAFIAK